MSYNRYSYKTSSGPGGSSYSYQTTGPSGSSQRSYQSSYSGSSSTPLSGLANDAEFQAAKMQAMMGSPLMPSGGSSSYSYRSSSSSSGAVPQSIHVGTDSFPSSSGSSGSTVKRVVTTTTTRTNPDAQREFESLERDFNRIGRTPANYQDDFESIKQGVLTGDAYKGSPIIQEPASVRIREEVTRSSSSKNSDPLPRLIPVDTGSGDAVHETTTTTTTKTYSSKSPSVVEEKIVKTSSSGLQNQPSSVKSETYIPVTTYDNSFDDWHLSRWGELSDQFPKLGSHDLEMQRLAWENKLGGIRGGFLDFPSSHGLSSASNIDSSRTVSKNPLGNPEFAVQFDMKGFKPENISITVKFGKITIKATHEEKIGNSTSRREFTRTVDLPADVQINLMRSVYSRDGILSITAPIKQSFTSGSRTMSPKISATPIVAEESKQNYLRESELNEEEIEEEMNLQEDSSAISSQPSSRGISTSPEGLDYGRTVSRSLQSPVRTGNHTPNSATSHDISNVTSPGSSRSLHSPIKAASPQLQTSHEMPITVSPAGKELFRSASRSQQSPSHDQISTSSAAPLSASTKPPPRVCYTVPARGFHSDEIKVEVERRRVKVHGKHVEITPGGRKLHDQFTKIFDLPASVDPNNLIGYIKDGHTLFVQADPLEDIEGSIQFVSITHKY